MKLTVITGYREYFFPTPVPADELRRALALIDTAVFVPNVRWAPVLPERGDGPEAGAVNDSPYPTFLYAEPDQAEIARRIALFLEYVKDAAPPCAHVMAVLPLESLSDLGARGPAIADACANQLVAAARSTLGEQAVAWCRVVLGPETTPVLAALQARLDGPGEGLGRDAAAHSDATVTVDASPEQGNGCGLVTMQRNYGRAVLQLAEAIVGRESILVGEGRSALVARLLEHNQLFLRTSLGAERILAELRPGGELFELLARPLPPLLQPSASSTFSPRRKRNATGGG